MVSELFCRHGRLGACGIPSPPALLADVREVHAHAVLAARSAIRPLAFEDGPDPEEAMSGHLDSVQARFGDAALDFGRVLRRRCIGRKIAFKVVLGVSA